MSNEIINPFQQFLDDDGIPLSNGTLEFFINTTTTLDTIFSDESLTIPQANPYTLDAVGRVTGDVKYVGKKTMQVKNSVGGVVRTIDNVTTLSDGAAAVEDINQDLEDNYKRIYLNISAAIADTTLTTGETIQTKGYTTENDAGGANYLIVAGGTGTDDGGSYHDLDNGLQAELSSEYITFEMFGASSAADSTTQLQAAFDIEKAVKGTARVTYPITSTLFVNNAWKVINGNNCVIENSTTADPLLEIGTTDVGLTVDKPVINDLELMGNTLTTSGLTCWGEQATAAVGGTGKRSRNGRFRNITINGVGAGYSLRVFSWQHQFENFTINRDADSGVWLDYEANAVQFHNIYITDCTNESVAAGIALDVPGGFIPVTALNITGGTIQSSGGTLGAVTIRDAKATSLSWLYFEKNNIKTNTSVYIEEEAEGTCVENIWNAGGAGFVVRDEGKGTTIDGVTTSSVASAIVQLEATSTNATVRRLTLIPLATGTIFVDNSTDDTSSRQEGRKFTELEVVSFEPQMKFVDTSGGGVTNIVGSTTDGRLMGFYKSDLTPQIRYDNTSDVATVGPDTLELIPETDNQTSLGRSGNRWTEVFAAGGVIVADTTDGNDYKITTTNGAVVAILQP